MEKFRAVFYGSDARAFSASQDWETFEQASAWGFGVKDLGKAVGIKGEVIIDGYANGRWEYLDKIDV